MTRPTPEQPAALPDEANENNPLEEAIEAERARLACAQSVLGCLRVALTYDEEDPSIDFADVAEVARRMVAEAVDRLDSVWLYPRPKSLVKSPVKSSRRRRVRDLLAQYSPRPLLPTSFPTDRPSAP